MGPEGLRPGRPAGRANAPTRHPVEGITHSRRAVVVEVVVQIGAVLGSGILAQGLPKRPFLGRGEV